ncbi:E3 ubiquitin-protein ligase TTC3 [Spea bombifrons]|uniref:E3 ubiquitin-protein ligase TTC3 n=1 Tax=Spea bombifrons TaxID=233779 RepID=UPI00234B8528|nr:E3 ubiquitin-protein ligase TTC3 [Spea bombifrons]
MFECSYDDMNRPNIITGTCILGHTVHIQTPPLTAYMKAVDPIDFWLSYPDDVIRANCDTIKLFILWPILIRQRDSLRCVQPRIAEYSDVNIQELNYIELVEDLADLVKKKANHRRFIESILKIGKKMDNDKCKKPCPIREALNWVRSNGEMGLYVKLQEDEARCTRILRFFFTEYPFYIRRMADDRMTMVCLFNNQCCKLCAEETEKMKAFGNEDFTRGRFDLALEMYTKAINVSPENHLLFSNRALCSLRMGNFWKALSDGKKAIILKQNWPKGHYLFCEALFLIGEKERALASNEKAQDLCKDSPDGIRDLLQQHEKFQKQVEEMKDMKEKKKTSKKQTQEKRLAAQFSSATDLAESKNISSGVEEDSVIKLPSGGKSMGNKESADSFTGENTRKGKSKGKSGGCDKIRESAAVNSNGTLDNITCRSPQMDLPALIDLVKSQVYEGYTALENQRFHSAQGIFSRLLDVLEQADIRELHLSNADSAVLRYGYANALLGIGQCEELTKAETQFKHIQQQYSKERFNCLAVYGIGNVYFRQNRFSDALNQYMRSQTMVAHKIVPGLLTWPTTSVVIEESRPEKLKLILENRIEECKFPPKPEAICRYEQCLSLPKKQIYFTDPDFKGFIRMLCCRLCKVEFHICCWKKLKAAAYSDKTDKDFLRGPCLTPDCKGSICLIVIFDSTGVVKCEFEDKIVKKRESQKPAPKPKGSGTKKLKIKLENKGERKKIAEEEELKLPYDDKQKNHKKNPSVDYKKGCYDTVPFEIMLEHIKQKEALITSGLSDTEQFQDLLLLWEIISEEELDALSFDTSCNGPHEEMTLLLKHLYKLNHRVKTRIFLYLLSKCYFLTLELDNWINMIDVAGLRAARNFHVCNEELFGKLNFEALINPWNETYGRYLDFDIVDLDVKEILDKLNDPESFRCFIWFLEEHRGNFSYGGLEGALDIYFTQMDAPYYNFRAKSSNEAQPTKCIKVKNKHKKKKQNQPKTVYMLSGAVSTRSQEEDIFTEENTLSLLDPNEPFIVPEYLRHQVEEFEILYDPDFGRNRYLRHFDSGADAIRETLYEYFSLILEEHGPLEIDEILAGEYREFPAETHQLVDESGGLKDFLLESRRFAAVGNLLGLQSQAALLQNITDRTQLNPTAKEFNPVSYKAVNEVIRNNSDCTANITYLNPSPVLYTDLAFNYMPLYPILPLGHGTLPPMTIGTSVSPNTEPIPSITGDIHRVYNTGIDVDPFTVDSVNTLRCDNVNPQRASEKPCGGSDGDSSPRKDKQRSLPLKHKRTAIVAVQVDIEVSEHDMNTDPFQPFETQQGDILRMEKEHLVLQEHLAEATEKYEHLQSRCQEEIVSLTEQINDTIEKNKITKKELTWLSQDLENEVKKYQLEKKENQEKIKALKNNIKVVSEANERCYKEIEEKKKQYETHLEKFFHTCLSNFEEERTQVERRTKERQEELAEIRQRALAAEVNVLENIKQSELLRLRTKASKAENSLGLLKAMASSHPTSAESLKQIGGLESLLSALKLEAERLKCHFDEKIKLAKDGTKLSSLSDRPASSFQTTLTTGCEIKSPAGSSASSPISAVSQIPLSSPLKSHAVVKAAGPTDRTRVPHAAVKPKMQVHHFSKAKGTAAQQRRENAREEARLPSPAKQTPFDKIIEELQEIFPYYKSGELAFFIKEVRSKVGGSLGGMKQEEVIARVTEYILDYQTKQQVKQNPTGGIKANPGQASSQQTPAAQTKQQPWRLVSGSSKNKWQKSNDFEPPSDEPCIICHDDLTQYPVHMLDCGHYFHKHCIKKWLNTQSTCPTCRDHALLPEDFPALSGRMRTA